MKTTGTKTINKQAFNYKEEYPYWITWKRISKKPEGFTRDEGNTMRGLGGDIFKEDRQGKEDVPVGYFSNENALAEFFVRIKDL